MLNSVSAVGGQAAFLTYSFNTAIPSYSLGDYNAATIDSVEAFTDAQKTLARDALMAWADVSGLTVFEVPAGQGDLQLTKLDTSLINPEAGGYAIMPDGPAGGPAISDVFIDKDSADWYFLYLHEIGHALGLKHPFDSSLGPVLDPSLDDVSHTVMSYTDQQDGTVGDGSDHLGDLDLQAIAYLYGDASHDGTQVASFSWDAQSLTLTQQGFATDDVLVGVAVSDVIHGAAGNDTIYGREGVNKLYGDAGDDTISGGLGVNHLFGGRGNDTLTGGTGASNLHGGNGADTLTGGDGNDKLFGAADNDSFIVGTGNGRDTVDGGGGDDLIFLNPDGGAKVTIDGGLGYDQLYVFFGDRAQFDFEHWATVNPVENVERVYLLASNADFDDHIVGSATADYIEGRAGNDNLDGGDGSDVILGGDGKDTIRGGVGNDFLYGGNGDDVVIGGGGADIATGDDGFDTFSYAGEQAGVTATINVALAGRGGSQAGFENVTGSSYGDTLTGDAGVNVLDGGAGADRLTGGLGDDHLIGGAGRDTFVFNTAPDGLANADTIEDFHARYDTVALDRSVFTAFAGVETGHAITGAMFKDLAIGTIDGDDRILYDSAKGDLYYDADGSAQGSAAVLFAHVDPGLALTHADFIVI